MNKEYYKYLDKIVLYLKNGDCHKNIALKINLTCNIYISCIIVCMFHVCKDGILHAIMHQAVGFHSNNIQCIIVLQ